MKMQKSFFEQNGGIYTRVGEVRLPDLSIGEAEQRPIGKYGWMRKHYLKKQHPILHSELLLSGKLFQHLAEIDEACEKRMERLTQQMAARRCNRGAQNCRSDGVGQAHEQRQEPGGRDRTERPRLLQRRCEDANFGRPLPRRCPSQRAQLQAQQSICQGVR